MRAYYGALILRVELHSHKPRMGGDLHYLNQVGIGELTTRVLRFLGIPAMLLGASLAVAAVFAFLASLLHAALLGGTIVAAFQGLRLGFSCGLAAVLLVVFAVVGTCCVLRARN